MMMMTIETMKRRRHPGTVRYSNIDKERVLFWSENENNNKDSFIYLNRK